MHVDVQEALSLSSIALIDSEDNPAIHSAPVMWEGRTLQLVDGPVNRKTTRSQFHRACFFETSAEPRAAIRLRALP